MENSSPTSEVGWLEIDDPLLQSMQPSHHYVQSAPSVASFSSRSARSLSRRVAHLSGEQERGGAGLMSSKLMDGSSTRVRARREMVNSH